MPQVAAISQQIWDMKYRLKGPDGAPVDKTIEDTWRRVAVALAEAEPESRRDEMVARFSAAMADFKFLPAGRIIAGAGAKRSVTLFNCFVMGTIPDDMSGIFEHLREAALTMQQGGGIGYDFSSLRPKGAPVKGVGADASGPLSFMDVWDAMCRTIMSAGHRRGAMMATLRCDHPDIEAFIEAKHTPGRLRMFNLSVLATDDFMQAIKEDRPWELKFKGVTYKVLQARELWDKIMRSTYASAEPGVIFIDRINQRNNLYYCESIQATNPCVTGDTWVQTTEGPRQVSDLIGRQFTAIVDGKPYLSGTQGFFSTGIKPVLRLKTRTGFELRLTADHPVFRENGPSLQGRTGKWVKAGDLTARDLVSLHNHRGSHRWVGSYGEEEGFFVGELATAEREEAADILALSGLQRVIQIGNQQTISPWTNDEVIEFAKSMGAWGDEIKLSPAVERTSHAFHVGFLRAVFERNGKIVHDPDFVVCLEPFHRDSAHLMLVQRMLLRLGIISTVRPGGRGLTISGNKNLVCFNELIGLGENDKQGELKSALKSHISLFRHDRFVAEVTAVKTDGEAEVFDVQIPGINAFDANGLVVHNCGEQPLPPYGACLLGSVNLAMLVAHPFEEDAALDLTALDELVRVAIRMLDDAIDVSNFPLEQQLDEAKKKRRIGLGVTGLADALIMCNARYGSKAAVQLTGQWMKAIERAAYLASTELAAEKGPFPLFDKEKFLAGENVRGLDEDVRAAIAQHGMRNGLLTSIAPTGTISIFADNVSSGLEPVFSFSYTRNILLPDGSRQAEEVSDHAYRLFRRLKGEATPLPEAFVDAQSLTPADHVIMQAAVQKFVDSAISKTINVPVELPFEDFKDIYTLAYESGCKGCTTYRPNEITGAVLETKPKTELVPAQAELPLPKHRVEHKPEDVFEAGGVVYMTQPLDRPEALPGSTYKIRWPESDHAIYVTINDIIQDGRRRPFEVFINSKNMEHYAWTVGLTRMISAVFRRGGDVSFVADELKAVFDPRGGSWMEGRYVPSLLAAIGNVIERHMINIGFLPDPAKDRAELDRMVARKVANLADGQGNGDAGGRKLPHCPKCGSPSLIRQEGCDLCTSCGYSKCG